MSKKQWFLEDAIIDYNMKKIPSCKSCKFSVMKSRMFVMSTYDFLFCKVKEINISKNLKELFCKYFTRNVDNFPVE